MVNQFVIESDEEEPDEEEEEAEDFEVEAILGRRNTQTDQRQYYIKWKGYDDPSENTWEPEENLDGAQELLEEFKRRYGTIHDIDLTAPKKEKEKRGRDMEHHKKHSREDRARSTARSEKPDVKHQKRAKSHMAPSVSGMKQEDEHKYKPAAPHTAASASTSAEERRKRLESAFSGSSPSSMTHADASAAKPSASANLEGAPTPGTSAADGASAAKEKSPKKPKRPKNDAVQTTKERVTQNGEKPPKKVKPPKDGKEVSAPTKRPPAAPATSDATKPASVEAVAQEKKPKRDEPETSTLARPSTSVAPQAATEDLKESKPEPTPSTSNADDPVAGQAEPSAEASRIDEMLAKQARGEGLSYVTLKPNELNGFQRALKVEQVRVIRRPGGADRCALVKFEDENHAQLLELPEVLANAPRELAIALHHQLGLKM